jgi:hypothetical protein
VRGVRALFPPHTPGPALHPAPRGGSSSTAHGPREAAVVHRLRGTESPSPMPSLPGARPSFFPRAPFSAGPSSRSADPRPSQRPLVAGTPLPIHLWLPPTDLPLGLDTPSSNPLQDTAFPLSIPSSLAGLGQP